MIQHGFSTSFIVTLACLGSTVVCGFSQGYPVSSYLPPSKNLPVGGLAIKLPFGENNCVNMCVHGIPALLSVFPGLTQDSDQDKPVTQE